MDKKYKVGYTTGVYDMFHIGHLNLLKRAKEKCDYLIVGVTTDELVSYKNKKAMIPFDERFEIIEAIRYHTTGRANMSTLEKLIFLADLIEPSRDYPGVEEIREVAYQDFEKGFLLAVKRSKKYLEERKVPIYYLTEECYNYYVKEN